MNSLKYLQADVQQFTIGKPVSFMCLCSLAQLGFFWHRGKTSIQSPVTEIMNLKKNTIFSLISCLRLNNIIFVEHIKLKISFKIFILSPVLLPLEHICLDQRHHQLPQRYAPSVFAVCLHYGNFVTHSFCVFSQERIYSMLLIYYFAVYVLNQLCVTIWPHE